MPKIDLQFNVRHTDGNLYRAGKDVEVPQELADNFKAPHQEKGATQPAKTDAPVADAGVGNVGLRTMTDGSKIKFTSDESGEHAFNNGLVGSDFDGQTPSSPNGFTKKDVIRILDAKKAA
jgi:cytoskeletal protein RodZ